MDSKDTFRKSLKDIRPSEFYLSEERLASIRTKKDIEPLPVKKIGDELFFTDGHHRAFAIWERGEKGV
ncbi:MAG: hypothetical protein R6U17_07010 [Thermoplasmata archaeon]